MLSKFHSKAPPNNALELTGLSARKSRLVSLVWFVLQRGWLCQAARQLSFVRYAAFPPSSSVSL